MKCFEVVGSVLWKCWSRVLLLLDGQYINVMLRNY